MAKQPRPQPRLTERQVDVLRLLSAGHACKDIARELGIGAETVRGHIAAAKRAMQAKSRTEAAVKAAKQGLF